MNSFNVTKERLDQVLNQQVNPYEDWVKEIKSVIESYSEGPEAFLRELDLDLLGLINHILQEA